MARAPDPLSKSLPAAPVTVPRSCPRITSQPTSGKAATTRVVSGSYVQVARATSAHSRSTSIERTAFRYSRPMDWYGPKAGPEERRASARAEMAAETLAWKGGSC
ncbi:unnamed protein product [Prorocentrum cordatum]|uniref:Uncharacterized protein n=1 Tax=Prorocentrum cordatum TaxID=2364126 RepID=A0ABN9VK76_9DINO|nr:unnamed protein product [Polarella glacialis]